MADIITACPIMYIAFAKLRNSFYMCTHLDFSVTNLLYIHIIRHFQELSTVLNTDAVICTLCQFVGHYNALPKSLYTILFKEKRNRCVMKLQLYLCYILYTTSYNNTSSSNCLFMAAASSIFFSKLLSSGRKLHTNEQHWLTLLLLGAKVKN